jgi:nitrite reductase/ring-hydroxylating ferredoxin subunit
MEWIEATRESQLADGERQVISVGGHSILLIRDDGQLYAISSTCPHLGLPLKSAKVEEGTLVCPWHHSAFDLETGNVQAWSPWPPAIGRMLGAVSREKALTVFPVELRDGSIWIGLDDGT